jgi:hypothetical protein
VPRIRRPRTRAMSLLLTLAAVVLLAPPGSALAAPAIACLPQDCVTTVVYPPTAAGTQLLPSRYAFWMLQMNLCNSGLASCYKAGRAIGEAANQIRTHVPDVVTLNEICRNDVDTLAAAERAAYPANTVVAVFKPAWNRGTGVSYKCANGQEYGIGIVANAAGGYSGDASVGGIYADQDTSSAEERAWVCLYITGSYFACTTHLVPNHASIAIKQCKYLMSTALPAFRAAQGGSSPAVMGGDLNMTYSPGSATSAQNCVPGGFYRKGDGDVQHIMASTDLAFVATHRYGMTYTDHDAWEVRTTAP